LTVEVRLENVTKRFGRVVALDSVTLRLPRSKFSVLLGPSGSGKTTLLYLIAGIYKPTEGKIFFDDRDVTTLPPNRRNVGLVFQNYALYPHMTVYDNIAFPLKIKKMPKRVIDERVRWVAKLLHIEELLDRYPHQLSGGQQQRVALARALVKQPDVLLLDEPLSNLDAILRLYIRAELKKLQRELEITAIYVTHDQAEAMALADQIVVIHKGKVQQVGTPNEVYYKPRNLFVATFIGNPPANILPAEVGSNGIIVAGKLLDVGRERMEKLKRLGLRKVLLGFRPEHAKLVRAGGDGIGRKASFIGEVYVVEPLGREVIVTLLVDGSKVKIVVSGSEVELKPGEKVEVALDHKHIMLFDPQTELNIDYIEA